MSRDKRLLLAILFNFLIVVIGIAGVCTAIFAPGSDSAMNGKSPEEAFRYFTIDGNIFCAFAAFIAFFSLIVRTRYSNFIFFLKFAAAVSGTLICIGAIALVPSQGRDLIYGLDMILLHIINPALCLISFLLFDERVKETRKKAFLYSLVPLLIYGTVAIILCLTKTWTGDEIPYPFLDFYGNPVWTSALSIAGITVGAIILAYVLDRLNVYFDRQLDEWN